MIHNIPQTVKTASVVGALMLASTHAFAQLPSAPPVPSGPFPAPANSALMVAVWDDARGVSLIQDLGFTFSQFTETLVTPESGGAINFGTLQSYDATFGASLATNVRYEVFAVQNTGGNLVDRSLLVTGSATAGNLVNNTVANAASIIGTFINSEINGIGVGCDGSPGANPCVTNANSDVGYAGGVGGNQLGPRFNNQLPTNGNASALVNTALAFYEAHASSEDGFSDASRTRYGNSANFASWLLTSAGNLTYSLDAAATTVPLPAAVWLLMSGIAGIGAVSRRRVAA
jgi:hypothetical protein